MDPSVLRAKYHFPCQFQSARSSFFGARVRDAGLEETADRAGAQQQQTDQPQQPHEQQQQEECRWWAEGQQKERALPRPTVSTSTTAMYILCAHQEEQKLDFVSWAPTSRARPRPQHEEDGGALRRRG
jgi:hypothetical protein